MKAQGRIPSKWHKELTNTVNMTIADELDLGSPSFKVNAKNVAFKLKGKFQNKSPSFEGLDLVIFLF